MSVFRGIVHRFGFTQSLFSLDILLSRVFLCALFVNRFADCINNNKADYTVDYAHNNAAENIGAVMNMNINSRKADDCRNYVSRNGKSCFLNGKGQSRCRRKARRGVSRGE